MGERKCPDCGRDLHRKGVNTWYCSWCKAWWFGTMKG